MNRLILKAALIPIMFSLLGLHGRRRRGSRTNLSGAGHRSDSATARTSVERARVGDATTPDTGAEPPKKKRKRAPRKSVKDDPYQRLKLRQGDRDELWKRHADEEGKVYDPETGEEIDPDSPWVTGHEPGWEFRKHRAAAEEYGTDVYPRQGTAEEPGFIEDSRNLDHYRPETKETSESHAHEEPDDVDNWKDMLRERYGTPEEAKARVEAERAAAEAEGGG